MKCLKPYYDKKRQLTFNCGQCRACRINYTSMWTLRLLYELADWQSASFITLTYNDANLPSDFSLKPKDLTLFWKNLRSDLKVLDPTRKIKYYACGEYGDTEKKYLSPEAKKCHGRPHYHAIVFGLDPFNDEDRKLISDNWTKCDSWLFDKNRKKDKAIDEVNKTDIAYVTGYVQKKLNGEMAFEEYGKALKPFSRCSQGMGLNFALAHRDRLINNGFTYLGEGHKVGIPRYFRDKFNVKAADLIQKTADVNTDRFVKEQNALMKMFESEMKRKNTWYPENLKMLAIRFERWFNDFQFEYSKQIERDYLQKRRMVAKI